jgi:hypothetical protein
MNRKIDLKWHEDAPILERNDGSLIMLQVLAEVLSGNWSTLNREFRELLRQCSLTSLWFFLRVVAAYNGPYDKLTADLHVDMANFYQRGMSPGCWSAGFIPRSHFKDLECSTPVLTANRGWVTHRELVVGDMVFSPSGKAVKVEAVTETYQNECLQIEFDDGAVIVAGVGHLWRVLERHERDRHLGKRRVTREPVIRRSDELKVRDNVGSLLGPLEFGEEIDLPLPPYILGVWLGDGSQHNCSVTGDIEDVQVYRDRFAELGFPLRLTSMKTEKVGTFTFSENAQGHRGGTPKIMRGLGLRECKHIPEVYFKSSIEARFELLRGLMDTDGTSQRTTATFVNTNKRLVDDVFRLASELGLRPRKRRHSLKWKGVPYAFFHVSFQHFSDIQVFKLPRKQKKASSNFTKRYQNRVKSITSVGVRSTNCVQVEGGLYLVGERMIPTHNSSVWTHGANAWEIVRDVNIEIGLGSAVVDRSIEFLRYTQGIFTNNEFFAWLFPELHVPSPRGIKGWNDYELKHPAKTRDLDKVNIQCISVGRSTAGIHVDLLKLDDVVSESQLRNDRAAGAEMEGIRNWMDMSLPTLVKDWATGRVNVSGTRYAVSDPYEGIMQSCKEAWGDWKSSRYRPKGDGSWIVYYRQAIENGVPIFPEAMSVEKLEKMREKDPWTFYTQYMNDPLIEGMAEFGGYRVQKICSDYDAQKRDWLLSRTDASGGVKSVYLSECDVLVVLDPAATESRQNARTSRSAIAVYATDPSGFRWVIDGWVDYSPASVVIDKVFEMVVMYQKYLRGVVIEQNGPFRFLEDIFYTEMSRRGVGFGLIRVQANSNKEARIRLKLQPLLSTQMIGVTAKLFDALNEEILSFPGGSRMDFLDAVTWGETECIVPTDKDGLDWEPEYDWYADSVNDGRSKVTGY